MKKFLLALRSSIIPSILLTLPIGSVYAFSLFSGEIATFTGLSLTNVQFAFSLSIFFLGMGASFGGPLVEKNINVAGITSALLFILGLTTTCAGVLYHNIWLIYIGYGLFNGLAQGIGYLTPVKTILLWFPKHKGLASSVSIISFGLGSSLCSLLFHFLFPIVGIQYIFLCLAAIYFPMMIVGSIFLRKPKYAVIKSKHNNIDFSYIKLFKDRYFIQSWLFMFLNISAGLALIGVSVGIFKELSVSQGTVIVLMALAGLFNGTFRLLFAWTSDILKNRLNIWIIISSLSIFFMALSGLYFPSILASILLINATYGGGFSTCPSILSDNYDSNSLSRVHGAVLSAWGFAGLLGNNLSMMIFNMTGSFYFVVFMLIVMYLVNLANVIILKKHCQKNKKTSPYYIDKGDN